MRIIVLLIATFIIYSPVYSQIPTETEAQEELKKRGIDEEELRAALLEEGIDIDNIDTSDPAKLVETQQTIERVMSELEAKAKETNEVVIEKVEPEDIPVSENEIKEAIEEGATFEEAINEEVQDLNKSELPKAAIYGQHLFRENSVKFYRTSEDAKPPSTYIIGPGDQVSVAIWGVSETSFSLEVSRDGYIKPDKISRIYISGLSIQQAKELIRSRLSRYYRFTTDNFDVNVATARTINVNITGEVFNVGSYNVSALNTAFNALVAANGPSDIGSIRKIKVSRAGSPTKTLDVYKYLADPLVNENFYLQDNDYIVVPVAEKVVEIKGAINRPYRYELIGTEDLNDLIKFAGGLKANALKRSIQITRIENDEKVILNVNLNELQSRRGKYNLNNGDIIEVREIDAEFENIVTINGSVEVPGDYSFKPGMKIGELMKRAKVEDDAILNNAYLMRLNPDKKTVRYVKIDLSEVDTNPRSENNIVLEKGDIVTIRAKSSFVDEKVIDVVGAVRIEGQYPFNGGNLKVSDAIFLSGGLKESATDFAFVFREKAGNDDAEYLDVDLTTALSNPNSIENLELQPGDKLVVYDRQEYFDEYYVSVGGAVRDEQIIKYDSSLTVKKALILAGGLTYDASLQQIDIFRIDFSNDKKTKTLVANVSVDRNYDIVNGAGSFKLEPFDQIFVRKAPEFELQRNITIEGEIKYPGDYALISDNAKVSELISQAGGVTNEAFLKGASLYRKKDSVGYIIIDVEKALKNVKSPFNAILQEGDILSIPKKNDLVTVTGAVLASEAFSEEIAATGKYSFVHEKGKNAKYYVDKYAGGVSNNGKASRITVTYPNGEVKRTSKFLFWNDYPSVTPGSVINVGYKDPKKTGVDKEKSETDWGKVLSDSVAQATTILTLVILINNL